MTTRKVAFIAADKAVIRETLDLPGHILKPPSLLLFRGKLYNHSGSGLGGDMPTNFYREVTDSFMIIEDRS